MYSVHTTKGIVINSSAYGEADKILSIFTEEFGLIQATARSLRSEKSKLRYHTQDYCLGVFSLVKGKEFWRLTGAAPVLKDTQNYKQLARPFITYPNETLALMLAKISILLKRLLQGEESNAQLFNHIHSLIGFIKVHDISLQEKEERLHILESLIITRILHSLGYVGNIAEVERNIFEEGLNLEILDNLKGKRIILNKHINRALKESQL
jgi:hypothetical protein